MKKNEEDDNKKYINETLAKSKTLTKSVNIFMQSNKLGTNNNPTQKRQMSSEKNKNKNKQNLIKKKVSNIKEESDEEDEEEDKNNLNDDDDEGIYTYEYVTSNIDRYQKKVTKFDELVKKNLLLSKKYPNKKDEYKDEAIRALKKKKFYSKALERYENRKLKMDLKSLDKEYQLQKKELKKITREFKKKVRLISLSQNYDENDDKEGGDDSGSSDEDNDSMFAQIDLDEKTLNEQYEQIIAMPEVKNASQNLNLFKFIFQEE